MTANKQPESEQPPASGDHDELARMQRELVILRSRLQRLEREVAAVQPLIQKARDLTPWDFTPYGVAPDGDWVAVDRGRAEGLFAALAGIDHWAPWRTRIEPRPQP